ncbi:hypothetical protein [Psychrobacillus sp. OK032]|uniref:hypothetical protein n=1 Tax=Psychrobacillus sp. OK032 TaxID=1884358 RepID=UPI0008C4AA14|nr:hypothetical protein [Psychrobacillus sp. OK032]SES45284.1 hypothetical protein SAMN05518872_1184 [Psychrobacillus sp. OK032]
MFVIQLNSQDSSVKEEEIMNWIKMSFYIVALLLYIIVLLINNRQRKIVKTEPDNEILISKVKKSTNIVFALTILAIILSIIAVFL